jgi:FMN phosphatase YigB (HAD superfamily)
LCLNFEKILNSTNKLLLFDLGGVIINLNTDLTVKAFAKLSERPEEDIRTAWRKEEAFKAYERGEMSDADFRHFLRKWMKKPHLSDDIVDEAWNEMILDLPRERLDFLLELKKEYQVWLLSNTNDIHLRFVNERVKASSGEDNMDFYFHKSFYSHRLGMRKPEPVIFNHIIKTLQSVPQNIIFLDDTIENIKGAEAVGIKTIEVQDPQVIFNVRDYV